MDSNERVEALYNNGFIQEFMARKEKIKPHGIKAHIHVPDEEPRLQSTGVSVVAIGSDCYHYKSNAGFSSDDCQETRKENCQWLSQP